MANRDRAHAKARAMGMPIRQVLPNGTVTEIMGLDENGEFLIYTTHNAAAAISSAANLVYPAPYNLDGTGVTVGVWDENAVRVTHQEFATGSRVTVRDGSTALSSHATHVAGTVGAAGVSATAKGMAPKVLIDSYNWTSDTSEMTAAGATSAGQAGKLTISNHSYGFATGWRWNGSNWQWVGTGNDQNAYAAAFGQYTTQARDWDSLAFNAPYYLIFKSAGNDNSNNPANGNTVIINGTTTTYDSNIHPKGNGLYRNTTTNSLNGYENISHGGNAKNLMTVGAANDAVTSGLRDPAKSTLTGFSSRGPTDDGRIKPDIVANGASLTSTESGSDTQYSSKSGTSMSSPSAAGSAALLVQLYRNLFPGGDMRASTLKGLIIHTATDIGNPGPDYHYGWGLMNTKEAADLIIDHHANPSKNRMIEDQLTTSVTSKTYNFTWDGSSPIRATMCWTDPAGVATSTHDLRTARLINDLDLKIIAPDGTQYYPFVMPFVGTWTVASMSAHATTGINSTDNVEQVLIQNPAQTGVWQAVVNYKGNLTNNQQRYSLLVSGVSDGIIPLTLTSITPNSGTVGSTVTADIVGTNLSVDTAIRLRQPGRADIVGTSVQMINDTTLRCQFNLTGAASGAWNLVATNPDAETFTLPDAFTISGSLSTIWSENFDGTGTNLSVTASDDAGEEFLTYTWDSTGPASVTYSLNGENAAKTTTASFSAVGDYAITVTALDTGGLSATSTVNVRVLETPEFIVTPETALLSVGDTLQFTANVLDQFGTPLATQPSPITWSTNGGGTISTVGLFSAANAGGPYTITASGGGESGTAEVNINATKAGIDLQNLSQTYDGSPRVVTATTTPAGLNYSITYDGQSAAPINAGSYEISANITDPNYEGNTTGTLVVAKATQTITFAALDPVGNNQEPFALTGTTGSGLAVSYTSSNSSVATVSGNIVTVISTGTTTITASQAGNGNYLPATSIAHSLEVVVPTYTITFDPNGGSTPSPTSKEVTFDAAYGTLATTNRTGYNFDGWFTAAEGGTEVTAETVVAIAQNHTLYAQWTADNSTGPGPLDHFVTSPIASPQTVGTPITGITITALDANEEIATSFTGTVTFGGTAGITGTSANFVGGVLTGLSVTPMVAGADLALTVDDGAGHTGSATFSVMSLFDEWLSSTGLTGEDADPNADSDGDGLTNLQEFAFGTDPSAGRPGPVQIDQDGKVVSPGLPDIKNFAASQQNAEFRAVFPRRKDYQMAGVIYMVEFSADLTRWTASATGLQVLSTESAGDLEAVSVPFPATVPLESGGNAIPKFFRIGVARE
jgi:uncharacterized repeat protein (TIGR02543 family)